MTKTGSSQPVGSIDPKERRAKRRAIADGRRDVAAGRVIADKEITAWLESWGTDDELAAPADGTATSPK